MNQCETMAKEAAEDGENRVGAIVVKDGIVISKAKESTKAGDITQHAEILAIQKASWLLGKDLSTCTLITTHEPCVMCSYVIRYHSISRVVYQHPSEYLGGIHSSFSVLSTDEVPPHWSKAPEIIQLRE